MPRHHRAITMWILLSLFVLLAGVMCLLGIAADSITIIFTAAAVVASCHRWQADIHYCA